MHLLNVIFSFNGKNLKVLNLRCWEKAWSFQSSDFSFISVSSPPRTTCPFLHFLQWNVCGCWILCIFLNLVFALDTTTFTSFSTLIFLGILLFYHSITQNSALQKYRHIEDMEHNQTLKLPTTWSLLVQSVWQMSLCFSSLDFLNVPRCSQTQSFRLLFLLLGILPVLLHMLACLLAHVFCLNLQSIFNIPWDSLNWKFYLKFLNICS